MKKILIIGLLIAGCVGFCAVAGAAEFRITKNGELLVARRWVPTGVEVTSEARKYPAEVEQAFLAPGKVVSVLEQEKIEMKITDAFHYRRDTVRRVGVKYDVKMATIGIVTDNEIVRTEPHFFPFLIFLVVSVSIMAYALFVVTRQSATLVEFFALYIALALASFVTAVTAALALFAAAAAALAAALAGVLSITAAVGADKKKFKVTSAVFFGLMALSAGLVYYPLFF